jgi:hypothetical protein
VLKVPFMGPEEERRGQALKGKGGRQWWSLNVMVSMIL